MESVLYLYNFWEDGKVFSKLSPGIKHFLGKLQMDYLRYPKIEMWINQIISFIFIDEEEKCIEKYAMGLISSNNLTFKDSTSSALLPIFLVLLYKQRQNFQFNQPEYEVLKKLFERAKTIYGEHSGISLMIQLKINKIKEDNKKKPLNFDKAFKNGSSSQKIKKNPTSVDCIPPLNSKLSQEISHRNKAEAKIKSRSKSKRQRKKSKARSKMKLKGYAFLENQIQGLMEIRGADDIDPNTIMTCSSCNDIIANDEAHVLLSKCCATNVSLTFQMKI